jgi:hypothetical protein
MAGICGRFVEDEEPVEKIECTPLARIQIGVPFRLCHWVAMWPTPCGPLGGANCNRVLRFQLPFGFKP